jgi:hypothetical protein
MIERDRAWIVEISRIKRPDVTLDRLDAYKQWDHSSDSIAVISPGSLAVGREFATLRKEPK